MSDAKRARYRNGPRRFLPMYMQAAELKVVLCLDATTIVLNSSLLLLLLVLLDVAVDDVVTRARS